MRLIDADALKEFIDDCEICNICPQKAPRCSYDCDFPECVTEKWNVAIDAQPTIDAVEVVHGEWIDMGDFEQCSVCKGTRLKEFQTYYGKATWIKTDFCPNCDAEMKGADDE